MAKPVYLSGGRIQGRSDDSVESAIPQTSWKELERTTLVSSNATIDSGTFTAKDNLMVLYHGIHHSGYIQAKLQVGNSTIDTGTNYASRHSRDGASDNTGNTSATFLADFADGTDNSDEFSVTTIRNIATKEKLAIAHGMNEGTSGAGNAPHRAECVGKWVNTSNQINRIQVTTANTFAAGSEIVILGCDDDEADSGTNFWQELTVKELSSAGDTIDTGTFTAKKYLKVDVFIKATSAVRTQFQFNSDTGSNYVNRNSKNGGTDSSNASVARIYLNDLERSSDGYSVAYINNVASKEKLIIYEDNWQNTTGTGTAPDRTETVAKWANTSDQITSIQLLNDKAGDFLSGSFIRVWGSD